MTTGCTVHGTRSSWT
uniref:Uncharacterized protein n=1 Tax=Romanomermis culicivorax TaxID=13658 RepID=A0A915HL95_ROMCU